ncbi:uncharacterized protein DSM5745_00763 [Aspergillus mulundensis]|uniref:Myb-like domain-containing protein n=1 Tax=Aspergillus mulundensis TaxID=1810919 RepID=A0A3D8T4Q4_9EURO|nr:hypothetical protein DSM5745_00763 [Aspergillus mulundensis]RDW93441.1 hypothetical protein DSM5745_00763 [Aspergillus mulundensis]
MSEPKIKKVPWSKEEVCRLVALREQDHTISWDQFVKAHPFPNRTLRSLAHTYNKAVNQRSSTKTDMDMKEGEENTSAGSAKRPATGEGDAGTSSPRKLRRGRPRKAQDKGMKKGNGSSLDAQEEGSAERSISDAQSVTTQKILDGSLGHANGMSINAAEAAGATEQGTKERENDNEETDEEGGDIGFDGKVNSMKPSKRPRTERTAPGPGAVAASTATPATSKTPAVQSGPSTALPQPELIIQQVLTGDLPQPIPSQQQLATQPFGEPNPANTLVQLSEDPAGSSPQASHQAPEVDSIMQEPPQIAEGATELFSTPNQNRPTSPLALNIASPLATVPELNKKFVLPLSPPLSSKKTTPFAPLLAPVIKKTLKDAAIQAHDDQYMKRIEALEKETSQMKRRLASLETCFHRSADDLEDLEGRLYAYENRIADLQGRLKETDAVMSCVKNMRFCDVVSMMSGSKQVEYPPTVTVAAHHPNAFATPTRDETRVRDPRVDRASSIKPSFLPRVHANRGRSPSESFRNAYQGQNHDAGSWS